MRKILIAICLVMTTTACFATRDTLTPTYVNPAQTIRDRWGATSTTGSYTNGVVDLFAPKWQFNTRAGTYGTDNEGSIVGIMARDVWEHGAKFCTTQIQSAWSGSRDWIDYFSKGDYLCEEVCEAGYSGEKCATHKYDCSASNVNYLTALNDVTKPELRILSGKQTGNITKNVKVFYYSNDYSDEKSYAIILGVIKRSEHAITVAPIIVNAKHREIKDAYHNGKKFVLCAPGYDLNDTKDDCVPATSCDPTYKPFCPGVKESDYKASQHRWGSDSTQNPECKRFTCLDGKAFEYEGSNNCVECPQSRITGVNNKGICEKCAQDQCFNSKTKGCEACKYVVPNFKLVDNRECWRKSGLEEFWGCVLCDSSTPCYNITSDGYSCGTCE